MLLKTSLLSLLLVTFTVSTHAIADEDDTDHMLVAELLTQEEAPEGVVYELIGNEGDYLLKAIKKDQSSDAHKRVQRLVADDVPVHICAVHASWRDVAPEDFPEYISISSTGPGEVRNYQEMGYTLIVVE